MFVKLLEHGHPPMDRRHALSAVIICRIERDSPERRPLMRRRDFVVLVGSATAWPLAVQGQQTVERMRRVAILAGGTEDSSVTRANLAALREELPKLGWIEGRNLRIDLRFAAGDPNRIRAYASEIVNLKPDAIVTTSLTTTKAVQQRRRKPILHGRYAYLSVLHRPARTTSML